MSEVKSIVEENEQLKKAVSEIQESLKGYEKDYDELCVENENLKAEIERINSLASDYKEEASEDEEDETASVDEDEEEEAMEENEEEAMEEDEEEAMEEDKQAESDENKQAKILAKALRELGVAQPITTKPQAVQMSGEEVMAKFASITDPKERGQFYAKHRNQIFN